MAAAAVLGKAMVNLQAALISKPDVGIYLLLPEMDLGHTELLREQDGERDYYADSKEGPLLVRLRQKEGKWAVWSYDHLRSDAGSGAVRS